MIHFPEPRDVKLRHVQTRMEKHGENDVPALDLSISVTGSNTLLDMLHPELRKALFKGGDQQRDGELELPVDDLPNKRFPLLGMPVKMEREQVGMTLKVAYGATGKADMVFGAVKLSKQRVAAIIEGGSVEILFTLSTTDVTEKTIGKLSLLIGHEITIVLTAPEVEQEAPKGQTTIDGQGFPFPPGVPAADGGKLTPEQALIGTADEPPQA